MIASLFIHNWRLTQRSKAVVVLLIGTGLVVAASTWWAASSDRRQMQAQQAAAETARADWLAQGPSNPHGMAHFGDFVFRPSGPLARLDYGVQARMGRVLRVEGHRQGTPLHAPASTAGSLGRFGRFDPAFVLQVVIPLVIFLLGSTATASDRHSGRLRWALAQGARGRHIVLGRFLHLWSVGGLALLVVLLATVLADPASLSSTHGVRLLGFAAVHLLFFAIIAAGTVLISFMTRDPRASLLILLSAWVLGTEVGPRTTATVAREIASLPTRDEFETQMRQARAKGLDGHNPQDVRLEALKQKTLAKYKVEKVEALPINFDGIAMQVDEEVANEVWDTHYGRIRESFEVQGQVARVAAVLNPFQTIDGVSMAFAGTDLAHDLEFRDQVEQYRRKLIKALNDEHTYGGSKTGDWSWKAEAKFYADLNAFEYKPPSAILVLGPRSLELITLLSWSVLLAALLEWLSRRIQRRGLA